MRRITDILLISIIIFLVPGCGGEPSPVTVILGPDTMETGRHQVKECALDPAKFGYMVYDLEKGAVLQSHNRDVPFIPASVTKIITILAALDILGPDFRFLTYLITNGGVRDGVLEGDLFLRGTGDPLLSMADLMLMARRLRELGVREIRGDFYYDESELHCADVIDPAMEDDVAYNSAISPLSLEYNSFLARWEKEKKTDDIKVTFIPALPLFSLGKAATSPGKDIPFKLIRRASSDLWLLSPEIEKKGNTRLPVHDAGKYTAFMFATMCRINGITIKDPKKGAVPSSGKALVTHQGRPLLSLAEITLTYSNNTMAELMLLASAKKLTGKRLDFAASGETVANYIKGKVQGIDWTGFHLANGSGLTSQNGITPAQMIGILLYANTREYDGRSFLSLLPASGWEWSLMSRLFSPETAFHIWAKTGTINYSIALAGYLFTARGQRLLFSFFITDRELRTAYEAEPDKKDQTVRGRAYGWIEHMKDVMDGFLEYWIREL